MKINGHDIKIDTSQELVTLVGLLPRGYQTMIVKPDDETKTKKVKKIFRIRKWSYSEFKELYLNADQKIKVLLKMFPTRSRSSIENMRFSINGRNKRYMSPRTEQLLKRLDSEYNRPKHNMDNEHNH